MDVDCRGGVTVTLCWDLSFSAADWTDVHMLQASEDSFVGQ